MVSVEGFGAGAAPGPPHATRNSSTAAAGFHPRSHSHPRIPFGQYAVRVAGPRPYDARPSGDGRTRRSHGSVTGNEHEHALLDNQPRDRAVAAALGFLTVAIFMLVAVPSTRDIVQRVDDGFLRWVLDHRAAWLTSLAKVFNVIGSVKVMLPVRILAVGFLAFRRRWWHVAAFVSAVVLSEVAIGVLKAAYHRPDLRGGGRRHRRGPGDRLRPHRPPAGRLGDGRRRLRVADGAVPRLPRRALADGCRGRDASGCDVRARYRHRGPGAPGSP